MEDGLLRNGFYFYILTSHFCIPTASHLNSDLLLT